MSENGKVQTLIYQRVVGSGIRIGKNRRTPWNGRPKKVKALYLKFDYYLTRHLSTAGHAKCRGNLGRPISKTKYFSGPIVN